MGRFHASLAENEAFCGRNGLHPDRFLPNAISKVEKTARIALKSPHPRPNRPKSSASKPPKEQKQPGHRLKQAESQTDAQLPPSSKREHSHSPPPQAAHTALARVAQGVRTIRAPPSPTATQSRHARPHAALPSSPAAGRPRRSHARPHRLCKQYVARCPRATLATKGVEQAQATNRAAAQPDQRPPFALDPARNRIRAGRHASASVAQFASA